MIRVFATPELLADAVARHVAGCAEEAIAAAGRFTIALSGGSTPQAAYSRLAALDTPPMRAGHWRLTHVFWGDERCVPPDDPRSNYRMAKEALLDRVRIPQQNIHRIRGEDDPQQAAAEYERTLHSLLDGAPRLDLVLLGLGEDGHTASLFPGQPAVHESTRWAVAVPGNPPRVTLTPPVLNAADNVTFVVSGAGKAARLQQVLEGPLTPDLLPAQVLRPRHGVTWMVDTEAGSRLRRAEPTTPSR